MARGAIILAGGDGTELDALNRPLAVRVGPGQSDPIAGHATMLEQTRRRVSLLIPSERTLTVCPRAQRECDGSLPSEESAAAAVLQPASRGTAPAILYALLRMAQITPDGAVAIFPYDHWIDDDHHFMEFVAEAFDVLSDCPERVVLLGIVPDGPTVQYGWIVPGAVLTTGRAAAAVRRVRDFWEKPTRPRAEELYRYGGLWNSFVMVGNIRTLLGLYARALPVLYTLFMGIRPMLGTPFEQEAVASLYNELRPQSFTDCILTKHVSSLAVIVVAGLQWVGRGATGATPAARGATIATVRAATEIEALNLRGLMHQPITVSPPGTEQAQKTLAWPR